ncbi:hypothetical protein VNO77_34522 [Canavalia gladiata]|uniref:Uncharacterized protein n=1 Tax=Canavalia gladiata TaxID=3824 RepID=A0AAN9KDR6_CANGL
MFESREGHEWSWDGFNQHSKWRHIAPSFWFFLPPRGILGKTKIRDKDLAKQVYNIEILLEMTKWKGALPMTQDQIEELIRMRVEGKDGIGSCFLGFSFSGTPDRIIASSLRNSD